MKDKPVQAPGEPEKPKKKPHIFLRFLAFLVTLALVLGAVALVVFRDRLNFDALRRQFTYRSLERSDSGQAQSFAHMGSIRDVFASVDGGLLVCSSGGVRLFSGSGVQYADLAMSMSGPVAMVSGAWSLAYDVGGQELAVFHNKETAFTLTLDAGKQFLSARINSSGYLAVITQESGYKGSVLVYDNRFQPLVQVNLSSRFLMDAVLSADNQTLVTVSIGQEGSAFESRLDFYRLDSLSPDAEPVPDFSCPLGNNLVLDLREQGGVFWALGENGLSAVSPAGELRGEYDYAGRYLKEFSLEGDGFAAVLLGRYKAGSQAELAVVSADGTAASLSIDQQVLSVSASGRYIAVLTSGRLDIYTSDLVLYDTLEDIQGVRKVLMRSDGSAMLIDNDSAQLYIPS